MGRTVHALAGRQAVCICVGSDSRVVRVRVCRRDGSAASIADASGSSGGSLAAYKTTSFCGTFEGSYRSSSSLTFYFTISLDKTALSRASRVLLCTLTAMVSIAVHNSPLSHVRCAWLSGATRLCGMHALARAPSRGAPPRRGTPLQLLTRRCKILTRSRGCPTRTRRRF